MNTVYTVGHSNRSLDQLVEILRESGCNVVCDVRSRPYSKYASQFNGPAFKVALDECGIRYVYLGRELGGRPDDKTLYDAAGQVSYSRLAQTPLFKEGIGRVIEGLQQDFVPALVCAERDPANCHRALLLGRELALRGIAVVHKHGQGRDESQDELEQRLHSAAPPQHDLFGDE